MSNQPEQVHQKISVYLHNQSDVKMLIDGLFTPIIKVIPAHDWSSIKAIWIPLLHHDYNNQLARSESITILQTQTDKFGTVQGYLTAPNENYIPYFTTFFNPTWTPTFVTEQILQAFDNIIETISTLTDHDNQKQIIKKIVLGKTQQGMLITLQINNKNEIIDAAPIFCKE